MKRKLLISTAIFATLIIFAAACGGGDDDEQVTTGDVTTTTSSSGATPSTQAPPPTARATTTTAGVISSTEECSEGREGGDVAVGVFSETSGLDPTVSSGSGVTGSIELTALYGTLMLQDITTGEYVPWLAESLVPNSTFDVWTLTLRDGVTYGNGDTMTTDHVMWNLQRFVAEDKEGIQRNQSGGWVAFIENYNIIDDLTMEIHLDSPWSGFPFTLADESGMIVNPAVLEARGGVVAYNRNPLGGGAGPFEFVSYAPQDRIVFEAKDDWWGGPVCIDTLSFTHIIGAPATYEAWQEDELQVAFLREAPTVARARANGDTNAAVFLKNLGGVLMVNNGIRGSQPPTTDVRLRRAIALAIDADIVDERANSGTGLPFTGMIHPESIYYDSNLFPEFDDDLDEAKRLVAEVKAEGNWDGTIRFDCHNAPDRIEFAIAVSAFLRAAGFTVELTNDGTINDLIGAVLINADYDIACWGFNLADQEPLSSMLQHTCTSRSNRTGYCDPRMDAAVAKLRVANTLSETQAAYAEAWAVWQETMPSVVVNIVEEYILFKDNIKGVTPSQASTVSFHKAYIEQ